MRFLTSFYWQEESAASLTLQQICLKGEKDSLLLACVCDSRNFGSCLVDWFHEEILGDYRKRGGLDWNIVMAALHRMAEEAAKVRAGQNGGFSCSGILCAGEEFVLFGQGEQRVYLLNRGFKGNRVRALLGEDTSIWQGQSGKSRDECREESDRKDSNKDEWGKDKWDKDESGKDESGKEKSGEKDSNEKKCGREGGMLELHQGVMESGVGLLIATKSFCSRLTKKQLSDCLGGDIRDERQAQLHLKELGEFSRDRGEDNLGAVFIRTL